MSVADDCFAHDRAPLSLTAALDLLRQRTEPVVGVEELDLAACLGRVLAEPVVAERDVPAFDNVAVDGWAFAHDGSGGGRLEIAEGRAAAGHPAPAPVDAGKCMRVLTGAPMPDGTDTVALQESVTVEAGHARLPEHLERGANRRRRGDDIRAGTTVLPAGVVLAPQHLGVAAEVGLGRLTVHRRLRVALFSTGDEIVDPGRPLPPGGVYDANRIVLLGLLATVPTEVTDLGILPDRADAVAAGLAAAAADHDVLLTSGGASRGDEDHVVREIARAGSLDFWRIAMKPGRPLAFGRIGRAVFIGLPGNPVAVMACFMMLARPALLRLAGGPWTAAQRFAVRSGFTISKAAGRTELVRARLVQKDGALVAERVSRQGSAMLTTMLEADGFVELDEASPGIAEGDSVAYLPFTELLHATEPR